MFNWSESHIHKLYHTRIPTKLLILIFSVSDKDQFYYVFLFCISGCGAIFQGSVFGLAGVLPKKYTQALMAGQGLGGILPALVSIITIAGKYTAIIVSIFAKGFNVNLR